MGRLSWHVLSLAVFAPARAPALGKKGNCLPLNSAQASRDPSVLAGRPEVVHINRTETPQRHNSTPIFLSLSLSLALTRSQVSLRAWRVDPSLWLGTASVVCLHVSGDCVGLLRLDPASVVKHVSGVRSPPHALIYVQLRRRSSLAGGGRV